MMLFKGYPDIVIRSHAEGASYCMCYPFMLKRHICFGEWYIKEEYEELINKDDIELTIGCLNEETLHFVLEKVISVKACKTFDNFVYELREYITSYGY